MIGGPNHPGQAFKVLLVKFWTIADCEIASTEKFRRIPRRAEDSDQAMRERERPMRRMLVKLTRSLMFEYVDEAEELVGAVVT